MGIMKGAFRGKIKSPKKWSPENPIFNKCSKRNLPATKKKKSVPCISVIGRSLLITVVCNSRTPSCFDTAVPAKREHAKLLSVVYTFFTSPFILD